MRAFWHKPIRTWIFTKYLNVHRKFQRKIDFCPFSIPSFKSQPFYTGLENNTIFLQHFSILVGIKCAIPLRAPLLLWRKFTLPASRVCTFVFLEFPVTTWIPFLAFFILYVIFWITWICLRTNIIFIEFSSFDDFFIILLKIPNTRGTTLDQF